MCQTDPIVGNSIKVEMYKHKSNKNKILGQNLLSGPKLIFSGQKHKNYRIMFVWMQNSILPASL